MKKTLSDKIKITKARKAILDVLGRKCNPQDAINIKKVLEGHKDINKVTVYRALSYLETKGMIRRVDLHKDSVFYELASSHHHHIICEKCGSLEAVEVCLPENIMRAVFKGSKKFSKINSHALEFFGLCKSCS